MVNHDYKDKDLIIEAMNMFISDLDKQREVSKNKAFKHKLGVKLMNAHIIRDVLKREFYLISCN